MVVNVNIKYLKTDMVHAGHSERYGAWHFSCGVRIPDWLGHITSEELTCKICKKIKKAP